MDGLTVRERDNLPFQGYDAPKICGYCGKDCRLSIRRSDWCDWTKTTTEGSDHHACVETYQAEYVVAADHGKYCHTEGCVEYPYPREPVVRVRSNT